MKKYFKRLAYSGDARTYIILVCLGLKLFQAEVCIGQKLYDVIGTAEVMMTIPCGKIWFYPFSKNPDFHPAKSIVPYQIRIKQNNIASCHSKCNYIFYPFGLADGFHVFGELAIDSANFLTSNGEFQYFTLKDLRSVEICHHIATAKSKLYIISKADSVDKYPQMFEAIVENQYLNDTLLQKFLIVFPKKIITKHGKTKKKRQ